jgi:3D-(3,5/4)-trihydroxycyclohexane-1,2-dione acylhydrolase (decyclizing)
MGAIAEKVADIAGLEAALDRAKTSDRSHVIVIDTDPMVTTQEGGAWWEVAVPEVSTRKEVEKARQGYDKQVAARSGGE